MIEVHKSHNLYNNLSLDNILLHFPQEESEVYIGVCDWSLTTLKLEEPIKSSQTFTTPKERSSTLRVQYWVDPLVAYLYIASVDIGIIPSYTKASMEFATAHIAQQILKKTMSKAHKNLQRISGPHRFSNQDLTQTFDLCLDRVCENKGFTLSHVINRFSEIFSFLIKYEE